MSATVLAAVTLSPKLTTFVFALVIPVAVGLITRYTAADTVKQVVTFGLSAVAAVTTAALAGDGSLTITGDLLADVGLQWATAVAAYLGLYKPHDLNARLAPTFGIGPAVAPNPTTVAADDLPPL